jgi:signal peptidase I
MLQQNMNTNLQVKKVDAQSPEEEKRGKSFFREVLEFGLIALLVVVPFRIYVAQPFVVNGASMDPTFENGEYLIVDQISYRFATPERGSILIFKYPRDPSKYFIKRVIGLPGETIKVTGGEVVIVNGAHPEGFNLIEPYVRHTKNDSFETTLKDDEYFVMGDNRTGSADSRIWGPLPEEDIVGRPVIRLFPLSHLNIMPGDSRILFREEI